MKRLLVIWLAMLSLGSCFDAFEKAFETKETKISGKITDVSDGSGVASQELYISGYLEQKCGTVNCDQELDVFVIVTDENGDYSFTNTTDLFDYFIVKPRLEEFGGSGPKCSFQEVKAIAKKETKNADIILYCHED